MMFCSWSRLDPFMTLRELSISALLGRYMAAFADCVEFLG